MRVRRVLTCLAVLAVAACGGSEAPAPITAPTPPPSPEPSAAPPVAAFTCPLPALPDLHNTCPKLTPQHWQIVENGIQKTIQDHPELFDFNDELGGGSWKVKDREKYINFTIDNIHAQGVCARAETEEIQVKTTNDFNEQYNIWVSSGHVRHGPGAYITTCFPAQF
jgi:hypothetical protein